MTEPVQFQSQTARFALPYLFAGQAQKEFFVNETIARLDLLLHPSIEAALGEPPADPEDGKAWLVDIAATGEWSGKDGMLAGREAGDWVFAAPVDGMRVWDRSTAQHLTFADGWRRLAAPVLPSGGATIDAEVRQALIDLVEILRNAGIFPAS